MAASSFKVVLVFISKMRAYLGTWRSQECKCMVNYITKHPKSPNH